MRIGLFIPCYVDALFPEVGLATYKLLKAVCKNDIVEYPERQTCCGQPMGNAGFEKLSVPVAEQFDKLFGGYDYVVSPSASCASYVRFFHPRILGEAHKECMASQKTVDLVEFLHDIVKVKSLPSRFYHRVSIHNSCHGVRELGLSSPSEQVIPHFSKIKELLSLVEGINLMEPERVDECCGFGGMFSVEEPEVSRRMGLDKIKRHMSTGAEFITGPDSSCLMHMKGIAEKENLPIRFIHIAQILAASL